MGIIRRLTSVFLAITIAICVHTSAFASANEIDYDKELMDRGYPQIILDTLDDGMKCDIYNANVWFAGGTIVSYEEESGNHTEINVSRDGSYILPRNQIQSEDLTLSILETYLKYGDNSLANFTIWYHYTWNEIPFFRWQDPIAVTWDSSIFRMKDDSFYKVDKYDYEVLDYEGMVVESGTGLIHSSDTSYANASDSGVTWYADLKGYSANEGVTGLYGYAKFVLEPVNTTYSGSSTLYGRYVHSKISTGIGITISPVGAISVTGGTSYDELGNQRTLSWDPSDPI